MAETAIGWDVGGANLKAARVAKARLEAVVQIPCPLWRGLVHLETAMDEALAKLGPCKRHALTMTGEMADTFQSRQDGVRAILAAAQIKLGKDGFRVFSGNSSLVGPEQAARDWRSVASANWQASAKLVASAMPEALFIDIGTTTTDVIAVGAGNVLAVGSTDAERLATDELVYTGIVRTPVMAVAASLTVQDKTQSVMAELFATMADVYRVTGELPKDADEFPTPDGRGKSKRDSARRIARMLGRDLDDARMPVWAAVARQLADAQRARIEVACRRVLNGKPLGPKSPLVGAGCGRFLVQTLAKKLGRPYFDFGDLILAKPKTRHLAAVCAPATALAFFAAAD